MEVMEKLISMTDFVIEQSKIGMEVQSISHQLSNRANRFEKIVRYAKFIKQPLMLGMFVPCDLENDPLLPPGSAPIYTHSNKYMIEYQEAKKRVLFEGIEYVEAKQEDHYTFLRITSLGQINYPKFWKNYTIEDLIIYDLTLTPTAKKQIGL